MVRFWDRDAGEEVVALEYLQVSRYEFANGLPYQIELIHVGLPWPKRLSYE